MRGDVVEIFPAYEEAEAIRVEFFGDEVDNISRVDPLRGRVLGSLDRYAVYPGSHYVTPKQQLSRAIDAIRLELRDRLDYFDKQGRFLEKQRLEQRTSYDLEMLEQMGFVQGIENYSRHLSNRSAGDPPPTLIDYFPEDFLLVIDESHQTVPQIGSMYRGDRSRKETLVEYGFRLPSALDNRPLQFEEFEKHIRRALFVSATPGDYELKRQQGEPIQQVIRPTGLMDPEIELRPAGGQVDNLLEEIRSRALKKRARAGHDSHQTHGGGFDRVLRGAGCTGFATCTRTSRPSIAWSCCVIFAPANTTCSWASNLLREGLDFARGEPGRHSRCRQGGFSCAGPRSLIQTIWSGGSETPTAGS